MNTKTINLEDYRVKQSRLFTSREYGDEVRIKSKIDDYIRNNSIDNIEIIVPDNIISLDGSFLEEFLKNAVSYCRNADTFLKK